MVYGQVIKILVSLGLIRLGQVRLDQGFFEHLQNPAWGDSPLNDPIILTNRNLIVH